MYLLQVKAMVSARAILFCSCFIASCLSLKSPSFTVITSRSLNRLRPLQLAGVDANALVLLEAADTTAAVAASYEAQMAPESDASFVAVTGVLAVTAVYWWTVVIPQQRTKLAISKSRGEVKEYLDELRSDGVSSDGDDTTLSSTRGFERWLFTDWLRTDRQQKPGAIPFIKKVKWNSGDNPILVAFAGIASCVLAASAAERVTSGF